jgi:tetratricopeptide (TPR) repeat protein
MSEFENLKTKITDNMKKLILALTAVLMVLSVSAQDGKKAVRQASRALGTFNLDQNNNKGKLQEAVDLIEEGEKDPETAQDPKTYLTKGEVYNTIANQYVIAQQLDQPTEGLPKVEMPAIKGAQAYLKALEMAEKRYEEKDAYTGLQQAQGHLLNFGIAAFQNDQDYELSYQNFQLAMDIHNKLKEAKEDSRFDAKEDLEQQQYLTGLAALNAGKADKAKEYFVALKEADYDEPAVYESLYKITAQDTSKMDEAYTYLEEGREKYPDAVSLLFAEINHFLRLGKMDELISRLEAAIKAEPTNASLYSTLGSVYDNLYQREAKAGNDEVANKNFDKALDYYEQALEQKSDYADAIYSIGALYYNRAASLTQRQQALAEDYSKEGIAKYKELQKKVYAEFDKALPYFQDAEKLNPSDVNTLIALKEIYARKDDLEMSKVFKERLDKVQAGEEVDSYFKNN